MNADGDSGRFARLFELLDRALALEGEERARFLDEACGSDPTLRAEIEVLLAKERASSRFLEPPAAARAASGSGSGGGAEHAADAPHVLGEFEIERELGRGATGVVYLARQRSLGREVALKVLSTNLTTTAEQVERFHREAQAVAKLRHPGIVKVFAHDATGSNHWFAMEYVEGHDLAREIELQRHVSVLPSEQPFLPRPGEREHATRVARLVADVARALHEAHRAGIVHRDVKPQNLLLQEDGTVRIGDFGLARDASLGSISATQQVAGTPHYMSPEQARVERVKVDHRTDVYSLGVVLYELCTLRRPYEGKTVVDVFERIRTTQPKPVRILNRAIPRDLETICAKAMAKTVDERYRSAADFADDLERFLAHEAIHARARSTWDRLKRAIRRHRARIGVAAVFALGVGLAAWASSRSALAGRLAVVTVAVLDERGESVAGDVAVRSIDAVDGSIGPPRSLGTVPVGPVSLEPGYYRFVAEVEPHGERSYARWVGAGERLEVRGLVADHQRRDDLVRVEGGALLVPLGEMRLPELAGRTTRVPDLLVEPTEVTNGAYRRYLDATGARPPYHWDHVGPEHDEFPVVYIEWEDARAYAEWLGMRLPTLAEWLWIAGGRHGELFPSADVVTVPRGVVGRTYDEPPARPDETAAELFRRSVDRYLACAEPVATHADDRTADGIFDLFGNVHEWTESPAAYPPADDPARLDPLGPAVRLVAGQAWHTGVAIPSHDLAQRMHEYVGSKGRRMYIGFRCVANASVDH